MHNLAMILVVLVAIEHIYIAYLEIIIPDSFQTGKVFGLEKSFLEQKNVKVLFKNQGMYNFMISIGLLYGLFLSSNTEEITSVFLVFIIIVAIFGSLTSSKSTFYKQGLPALIALLSVILS